MFVYILMGGIFILSMIVQNSLKTKFAKYSKVPLGVPMAGRDIANAMLQQNGCGDVKVTSVSGQLTDHFNPANRTVNLSEPVYGTNSIAAAAVAAHECGHAVQHKVGYSMLQLRTKMVPIVSFASNTIQWLLLAGIVVAGWTPIPLYIALAMFAMTVLFSFVTLPVEVDASRRAVKWLCCSLHLCGGCYRLPGHLVILCSHLPGWPQEVIPITQYTLNIRVKK